MRDERVILAAMGPEGKLGPPSEAAGAGKRHAPRASEHPCNVDPRDAGKRSLRGGGTDAGNVRPPPRTAERFESALGSQQEGSVKRSQLLAAGVSRHVIDRQLRAGALHRSHRGVYLVGHEALAPRAKEAAALLACGKRALVSHRSAAYLWGLLDEPPDQVEITLVGGRCRPKEGVRIRTVKHLDRRDARHEQGIWLTSPARTIIDLAADATDAEFERLVAHARVKRVLRDGELEAALTRAGRRPGTARARAFMRSEGEPMTRSEIERVTRRLIKAAGLPEPKINQRLLGYEVDFLWSDQRVILEVDTYTFHGHRRAFERDRRKTIALEAAGYHVIRVTRRQVLDQPYWVIAHIARALSRVL